MNIYSRVLLAISTFLILPPVLHAQVAVNGAAGNPPATTMLAGPLASMPTSCTTGQSYYATDQAVGSQFYECSSSTNTFALIACNASNRGDVWFMNGGIGGDSYLTCMYTGSVYQLVGATDLITGNIFSSASAGLAPATGGVDSTHFLNAAGQWAVPPGANYTATPPLSRSGSVFSIPQANGTTDGYLSHTDFSTFNGKQDAGNYLTGLTVAGDISGTVSGPGSPTLTLTLPNVNTNTGTFGSSSEIPILTVNAKGQITAVSTAAASGSGGTTYTFDPPFSVASNVVSLLLGPSGGLEVTGGALDIDPAVIPQLGTPNTFTASLTAQDGLMLYTANPQPTCSATTRGDLWYLANGPDVWQSCENTGTNTTPVYAWTGFGSGFTGTAGSIPFVGTGGSLTEDNANLNWNDSSKQLNVGGDAILSPSNAGNGWGGYQASYGGYFFARFGVDANTGDLTLDTKNMADNSHSVLAADPNNDLYLGGNIDAHVGGNPKAGAAVDIMTAENNHVYTHGSAPTISGTNCYSGTTVESMSANVTRL